MSIKDLSPKLSSIKTAEEELVLPVGEIPIGQKMGGVSMFSNTFKRGYGSNVFGSDENGIWLGSADYKDAPFRVGMNGSLFTQSTLGNVVIDTPNNRILVYDENDIPIILIGYHQNGF